MKRHTHTQDSLLVFVVEWGRIILLARNLCYVATAIMLSVMVAIMTSTWAVHHMHLLK